MPSSHPPSETDFGDDNWDPEQEKAVQALEHGEGTSEGCVPAQISRHHSTLSQGSDGDMFSATGVTEEDLREIWPLYEKRKFPEVDGEDDDDAAFDVPRKRRCTGEPSVVVSTQPDTTDPSVKGKRKESDSNLSETSTSSRSTETSATSFLTDTSATSFLSATSATSAGTTPGPMLANDHPPDGAFRTGSTVIDNDPLDVPLHLDGNRLPMQLVHYIDKCPWGVQWCIARQLMLTTDKAITAEDITLEKLHALRGSNVEKMKQFWKVLKGKPSPEEENVSAKEELARSPWEELDYEATALATDSYALTGATARYGGRVHFIVSIKPGTKPKFMLERPVLSSSNRFSRRWGSASVIRLRYDDKMLNPNFFELIMRPFVIFKRVFRALRRKDSSIFLVEVADTILGHSMRGPRYGPRSGPRDYNEYLEWHNPLCHNNKQTMAKYAARYDLAFSNSVPVCVLQRHDIISIEDEVSTAYAGEPGEHPAEQDMTDGCGYGNRKLFLLVQQALELDECPICIQMRLAGAKGLLILHPKEADACERPRAWLRPSQFKINYGERDWEDPSKRTLDVLRTAHIRTPSRLSTEVMINLDANGIPPSVITDAMEVALTALIQLYTTFSDKDASDKDAMQKLWQNVAQLGNVLAQRRARQNSGEARARGFTMLDSDDDDGDDDDEFDRAVHEQSMAWVGDPISGCPSGIAETILELLDAGFTPQNCPVLLSKLEKEVESAVTRFSKAPKFSVELPMSCTGFLVPDPTGSLEEGEVFIRSSRHDLKHVDGSTTDVFEGDVLLARNPCKLPTDVQKMRAVNRPELRAYVDVIVMSTKGSQSPASKLAGGDYDGDKALAIMDPAVVMPFNNDDAQPPPDVKQYLKTNPKKVHEFQSEYADETSAGVRRRANQDFLLASKAKQHLVGKYSNWHRTCVYLRGYDDALSLTMAQLFCQLLDGAKSGLVIQDEVLAEHEQKFKDHGVPEWTVDRSDPSKKPAKVIKAEDRAEWKTTRDKKPPAPFAVDVYSDFLKAARKTRMTQVKVMFKDFSSRPDNDLERPWRDACERSRRQNEERRLVIRDSYAAGQQESLEAILKHISNPTTIALVKASLSEDVKTMMTENFVSRTPVPTGIDFPSMAETLAAIRKHVEDVQKQHNGKIQSNFSNKHIVARQDIIRELSRQFYSGPVKHSVNNPFSEEELRRIAASCAYTYECDEAKPWSRYPFDVAFRDICNIKAMALGRKPVVDSFYEQMVVKVRR